jgi:LAS superfamily LD-carboxypeptidase LdcB
MARRKKKKSHFKVILIGLVLLTTSAFIYYITRPDYILKKKGYDVVTVSFIMDMDNKIIDSTLKVDYKDYILELINDENYDYSKIKDYINYYENNEDIKIKDVISIVNDEKTEVENIDKFAKDKYFIYSRLDRYFTYYDEHNDVTTSETIRTVNTDTDYDYYTNITNVDLSKKTLMLVNKYHKLDSNYVPDDLVDIDSEYGNGQLQKDAYQNLVMMADAAKEEGLYIYASSTYRSYDYQLSLYNGYVLTDGQEVADSVSAKAGHSEHQTGLAMDLRANGEGITYFKNSNEFKWVKDHAHLYGFIMRYPEGSETLTGYSYESWHYRYVGTEVAKYIYENNMTFDEYYAYFIGR